MLNVLLIIAITIAIPAALVYSASNIAFGIIFIPGVSLFIIGGFCVRHVLMPPYDEEGKTHE